MVLQNFSKFVSIHLTKWHQEKKNTYVVIICHFLINNYLAHTQKRMQLRNRYLKKGSYQNKRLFTEQRNFCVSLLRKTKKKAIYQSKSLGHS